MVNSEASTCKVIIQVRHCLQHTIGEHREEEEEEEEEEGEDCGTIGNGGANGNSDGCSSIRTKPQVHKLQLAGLRYGMVQYGMQGVKESQAIGPMVASLW